MYLRRAGSSFPWRKLYAKEITKNMRKTGSNKAIAKHIFKLKLEILILKQQKKKY